MDMPRPMQEWNRYRAQAMGLIWQREGLRVVPTLSWAGEDTYSFTYEGIPRGATVATSTVGVKTNAQAQEIWHAGMRAALNTLSPSRVLLYGGNIGFDFGEIEVIEYKAGGFHGR